jgi:TRAP transporter 4TM/12TM fusion protein
MAELLGVPYTKVMLAAAIPAFLYYLALIMAVHFEARKLGLRGLARENIPDAVKVLKERGHLAAPLIVLLAVMGLGFTPLFAASFAIVSTVAASWLRKETRMSFKTVLKAIDEGARGAVGVGAACVIIGIIIGTVTLSSLGLTFMQEALRYVGQGQLYLGGFLVMIMSVILGMGVPGVAAYVIVAAVAVPVLIKVGVGEMAAHMFCLFYACLSNITPPVAMSSFVAAGIARSDQTRTSLIAVRLGLAGFILPFFFLDNPVLLYDSDHGAMLTLWATASASLGVIALAAGLEGWLLGPCNILIRLMLLATAGLAIHPGLSTDAAGLALFAIALFWSRARDKKEPGASPRTPSGEIIPPRSPIR